MKSLMLIAAATAALVSAAPASAQSFGYTDFANTSGLQINGDAGTAVDAQGRSVLRVTPATFNQAGSAFSTTQIALGANASFSTAFTFNFNGSGGLDGADGLVFVVQSNSNSVGTLGAGIGYQGILNSLGVEFDTYRNIELSDPVGDHVGINLNGSSVSQVTREYGSLFDTGTDFTAFVDYNGATQLLEVRVGAAGARPATAFLTLANLDLASVLGTNSAFVGFTSGTGAGYSNHDVINWQFNNAVAPIQDPGAVPEPATWGLMLVGFGVVGAGLRSRRSAKVTYA